MQFCPRLVVGRANPRSVTGWDSGLGMVVPVLGKLRKWWRVLAG